MVAVQKSTYISAGGHAALLGFAMFGGLFTSEPLELPSVEVSVVSEAEFEALIRSDSAPEIETPVPQLAAPAETPDEAQPVRPPEPVPEIAPTIVMPDPIVVPEAVPQPAPQPAPIPDPAPIAPPVEDVVVIPDAAPESSLRPKPRPADRVAAEAVAAPDPSVAIDNAAQAATQPDADADVPIEEQSETAPEEATTEIITEAETPASAPAQSQRPKARPRAAAQAAAAATSDAVSAALSEALGEAGTDTSTSGPPLTAGETNALRLAVQSCWVVDVGNPSANVSVVVGMSMDRQGKVVAGSLRLVSSKGGEGRAVETAFQSARRAILRCQKQGYDLPTDKYEQWKDIEMTFNPKDMRVR